jgi:hypothetical protein
LEPPAHTRVLAWPMPGHARTHAILRDLLASTHATAELLEPTGDVEGVIFDMTDEYAPGGLDAYRELIERLASLNINVYAVNHAAGEIPARAQYHPVGGERVEQHLNQSGWIILGEPDILTADAARSGQQRPLAEIPGAVVGLIVKHTLRQPELPAAIKNLL